MNNPSHELGIKPNLGQFLWLVLATILVGMTVGLERTVMPVLGKYVYHVVSLTVLFSFIVAFGATKAVLNLAAGQVSDKIGRRPVLIIGWLHDFTAFVCPFLDGYHCGQHISWGQPSVRLDYDCYHATRFSGTATTGSRDGH